MNAYMLCLRFHPSLIFNMDETAIEALSGRFRVIVPKDCRTVIRKDLPHFNHHMTLVMCVSADGEAMRRPTVILPLEHLPEIEDSTIQRYNWSGSSTGWITKEIWSEWIANHFIPWVEERRRSLPASVTFRKAVLYMDSHVSRLDEAAHDALEVHDIMAITIPSHSSHILQPLDCGVNNKLKSSLKRKAFTGRIRMDGGVGEYRASVLKATISALYSANNPDVITEAFKTTGICPWNPRVVLDRPNILEDDNIPESPNKTALQNISGTIVTAEMIRTHREQREAEVAAKDAAKLERQAEREAKREARREEKERIAREKAAAAAEKVKAKLEKQRCSQKKRKELSSTTLTSTTPIASTEPITQPPPAKKCRKYKS